MAKHNNCGCSVMSSKAQPDPELATMVCRDCGIPFVYAVGQDRVKCKKCGNVQSAERIDASKEKTCTGKRGYTRPEDAERVRKQMEKKTGEFLNSYRCKFCGLWHIGHARKVTEPEPPYAQMHLGQLTLVKQQATEKMEELRMRLRNKQMPEHTRNKILAELNEAEKTYNTIKSYFLKAKDEHDKNPQAVKKEPPSEVMSEVLADQALIDELFSGLKILAARLREMRQRLEQEEPSA